ncbi:hypothetical protein [Evansella clarkii]|uniref:hypothetical protein n=1 Tax=Evansella clarkii TaxID=79879 RepID=UPI00099799B1|nr:hypothetical protein [Evansella clarkii]
MNTGLLREENKTLSSEYKRWTIPALLLFFNPLTFMYLGVQLKKKRFMFYALFYSIPLFLFPVFFINGALAGQMQPVIILLIITCLLSTFIALIHTFSLKRKYSKLLKQTIHHRRVEMIKNIYSKDESVIRSWLDRSRPSYFADEKAGDRWYKMIVLALSIAAFIPFLFAFYYFALALLTRSGKYLKYFLTAGALKLFALALLPLTFAAGGIALIPVLLFVIYLLLFFWLFSIVHLLALKKDIVLSASLIIVLNSKGVYMNKFDKGFNKVLHRADLPRLPDIRHDI